MARSPRKPVRCLAQRSAQRGASKKTNSSPGWRRFWRDRHWDFEDFAGGSAAVETGDAWGWGHDMELFDLNKNLKWLKGCHHAAPPGQAWASLIRVGLQHFWGAYSCTYEEFGCYQYFSVTNFLTYNQGTAHVQSQLAIELFCTSTDSTYHQPSQPTSSIKNPSRFFRPCHTVCMIWAHGFSSVCAAPSSASTACSTLPGV